MVAKIFPFVKKHAVVFISIGIIIFAAFFVSLNGVGLWDLQQKQNDDDCQDYSSDAGKVIKGAGGAWTTKGTRAYKTAKAIFQYWVSHGLSGAQAAGIIGNVAGAEDPTFSPGQEEIGGGDGQGFYQFTPTSGDESVNQRYTKRFGKWTVKGEGDFVRTDHRYKGAYEQFLHASKGKSPAECAYLWETIYERPASVAATKVQRQSAAQKAYRMFGGAKYKGKNSLLGGAAKGASDAASSGDDDCDNGGDGGAVHGDIAKTALRYIGWFHYEQSHGESYIGSVKHPNKNGVTDCSGFVWFALAKAGYKVPANMGWYTKTMEQDAKGAHHWLHAIPKSKTRRGDIIIVNQGGGSGDDGHTAILLEKYHGNSTRIVEEGGTGGDGGVNKSTIGPAFGSLLNGGSVTFARAIKK